MRRDYRNVDLDTFEILILQRCLENLMRDKIIDSEEGIENAKRILNKLEKQLEIAYKEM